MSQSRRLPTPPGGLPYLKPEEKGEEGWGVVAAAPHLAKEGDPWPSSLKTGLTRHTDFCLGTLKF